MNNISFLSLAALTILLSACSTPVDLDAPAASSPSRQTSGFFEQSDYRCDAEPAQTLVGKRIDDNIEAQARKLSGSKVVRTLRPGQVITMEYNPERVNVRVDDQDLITTVGCG